MKYLVENVHDECSSGRNGQHTSNARAHVSTPACRVASRPGSTTCRILASVYAARNTRPDTVPKISRDYGLCPTVNDPLKLTLVMLGIGDLIR